MNRMPSILPFALGFLVGVVVMILRPPDKRLADCERRAAACTSALQGSVRNTRDALRQAENATDLLTAERADRDLERRLAGRPLAGSRSEFEASR